MAARSLRLWVVVLVFSGGLRRLLVRGFELSMALGMWHNKRANVLKPSIKHIRVGRLVEVGVCVWC